MEMSNRQLAQFLEGLASEFNSWDYDVRMQRIKDLADQLSEVAKDFLCEITIERGE